MVSRYHHWSIQKGMGERKRKVKKKRKEKKKRQSAGPKLLQVSIDTASADLGMPLGRKRSDLGQSRRAIGGGI
jgi:hypothetical protein